MADYGSPEWIAEFRRAYPGADVAGRLGRLLVLRFADGMLAKAVGGSASAPTVMALEPSERVQFERAIRREAGSAELGEAGTSAPSSQLGRRLAFMAGGAAIWGSVAAAGAKLSKDSPALGAGVATGLLSLIGVGLAATVPLRTLGPTEYTDPESAEAETELAKSIRRALILTALGGGAGGTGGAVAGAKLAKKHPATGAAVGSVVGAFAASAGAFALVKPR